MNATRSCGQRIAEHLLERWFGLYCNISGVSGSSSSSSSRRKGVFATVVNSVVTRSQARVVWSGQSGQESCDAAECGDYGGTCDGRHLGLRVRSESRRGETFATRIHGQLGVCYNPQELDKWARKKDSDGGATTRMRRRRLIQKFLENCDNVFEVTWSACGAW
jgi:hypothetical protein